MVQFVRRFRNLRFFQLTFSFNQTYNHLLNRVHICTYNEQLYTCVSILHVHFWLHTPTAAQFTLHNSVQVEVLNILNCFHMKLQAAHHAALQHMRLRLKDAHDGGKPEICRMLRRKKN